MNETKNRQDSMLYRFVRGVFDYLELFAFSVLAVFLIFTFGIRTCQVDGQSMENTLFDKEYLIIRSFAYEPKQDDIIVFHGLDKTLVKRVIAVGGQEVIIDTKNNQITVDNVVYADTHAVLKNPSTDEITDKYLPYLFHSELNSDGLYKVTVPEGKLFVMGDNRNNSADSRDPRVGFIDERSVLGKVILRVSPFTVFS